MKYMNEDTRPAPDSVSATACVAYVDNGVHLGCSRESVAADKQIVTKHMNKTGLDTHDEIEVDSVSVALVFL